MINSVILAAETLPVEYLDIVSKVDSFYNSAWTKLILIIGGFFSVLTVLGPLYINWYQKKHARYEQEKIEKNLENYIDEKFKDKQSKFDKKFHRNIAMTMHVQGNAIINDNPYDGIRCYFDAAKDYLKAEDHKNLDIILKSILRFLKDDKISSEKLIDIENYNNISIIELINKINNDTNNHTKILNKIRYTYKKKVELHK